MKLRTALLVAIGIAGCGGGGAAPGAAPKSVEQAPGGDGRELDTTSEQPEGQEGYAQPGQPGYGQPGSGQQPATPVGPTGPFAEAPPQTMDEALAALDSAATELATAGKDCERACKALESMQRSSDRICELNGPDDPGSRCQKAKSRVDTAKETLKKRCGSCGS